ncbi:MAG: hypothetical protein VW683_01375 [Betaproteobacteria bacterium]|jgi:hypothetical protein
MNFIDYIIPYKIPGQKKRLGSHTDGGYVVPEIAIQNSNMLLSAGVHNDWSFEQAVYTGYDNITQCVMYEKDTGYAHGCGDLFDDGWKLFYEPMTDEVLKTYTNSPERIFFKMDIDQGNHGFERDVLNSENLKINFSGMVIEWHQLGSEDIRDIFMSIHDNQMSEMVLCHVHGNNWGNTFTYENYQVPVVLECTYIHRYFLDICELDRSEYPVHGLDLPNNPNVTDYELTWIRKQE